jgi:hypothetical protein
VKVICCPAITGYQFTIAAKSLISHEFWGMTDVHLKIWTSKYFLPNTPSSGDL